MTPSATSLPCAFPSTAVIETSSTRGEGARSSLAATVATLVIIFPFGGQIVVGVSVTAIVGGVTSAVTMANGSSEGVPAQMRRPSKSGAGEAGARMVRSRNVEPATWRTRSVANVAASLTHGTLKQIVTSPANAAVVVTW